VHIACTPARLPTQSKLRQTRRIDADLVGVVIASLEDLELFVVGSVDEAVFVVNASRPVAGQVSLERFGLTDAVERIALDLADETNNAAHPFAIGLQPVLKVVLHLLEV